MAAIMTAIGAVEITPKTAEELTETSSKIKNEKVTIAVIGCGLWGREILKNLTRLPNATVLAVCDVYEPFLKRGSTIIPNATQHTDYKKVLESKDIKAVIIATPSHLHRQIAIDALQAGKHVYCEAPLATNIDDAREIAKAASSAKSQIFQSGLILRSSPIHNHVLQFIRTGALGKNVYCRAQYHKKQSWRRSSPNPDREKAINWHLNSQTSLGLIGEIGIHYLDVASWFLKANPIYVTGFGGNMAWDDGRDVADTIKAVFEYPNNVLFQFDATLANSYEGSFEAYYGTDSAIVIRDGRAWMMKETDAPLLGWEVYARKDEFNPSKDTGIALIANSTKLLAQGKEPASTTTDINPPIYYALEEYLSNIHEGIKPSADCITGTSETIMSILSNDAIKIKQKATLDSRC